MSDYISREDLDEAFTALRWMPDGETLAHWGDRRAWCLHGEEIELMINKVPSVDAVKVTRCSDCIHWEPEAVEEGDSCGHCRDKYGPCYNQQTDMNWFCADGEKG